MHSCKPSFFALAALVAVGALATQAAANDGYFCSNASGYGAIAACSRAIVSGEYKGTNLAKLHFNRGIEYEAKGEDERAIADYSEAIKLDPKYVRAYGNRGILYARKGELDRAIADYSEAIRLDPKYVNAYGNRGNALRRKGELDRAIADLDQAIGLDPKGANLYYNRGLVREAKGDLHGALADFKMYAELEPSDPDGPKVVERVSKALGAK